MARYNPNTNIDYDRAYLQTIRKFPLLTREEETDLAIRCQMGDEKARETLINSNLRLVFSIALKFRCDSFTVVDLMQEGTLGLMRAVEKYDPYRGYRFSTYATYWIRQSILRGLANKASMIRIPVGMLEAMKKMNREEESFVLVYGREPSAEELAGNMGVSVERIMTLKKARFNVTSFDIPAGEKDNGDDRPSPEDTTPDENIDMPGEELFRRELETVMREAIGILSEREKDLLTYRYGLGSARPHSLEETGKRLGVTRERVSQLETRALKKLYRRTPVRETLRPYLH